MQSAVYAMEVSKAEYMCYTTEESEKMKVIDLAEELGGDMQEAIRRLSGNKERKA